MIYRVIYEKAMLNIQVVRSINVFLTFGTMDP